MSEAGLSIVGDTAPGFPARQGYGARAYGNTSPETPLARSLLVSPYGRVTVYAGKVEYGQNIRTGFAVEVAEELRVPLSAVNVVLGDTNQTPWDMGTFGSQSTARVGLHLRMAVATARQVLLEFASQRLDLPREDLVMNDGRVASNADPGRGFTYGELLDGQNIEREIDKEAPLTEERDFKVMGSDVRRIDAEARVTGRSVYAQDVLRPGMLFARILHEPSLGARLVDVDSSGAEHMPGLVSVVRDGDLVAVLAEDDESADRALSVIQATWEGGKQGSTIDVPRILAETKRDPVAVQETGDVEGAFRRADNVLEATYYAPHISTLPMEPRAAVAEWDGDKLTVWAGTQRPFGLRTELAGTFRVPETDVRVISMEIGGGFGTKSWYPTGAEAAKLARLAGRPVRVAYNRQEDATEGTFRPAALIEIRSAFRTDGKIMAWKCKAIHAGPLGYIAQRGAETPYAVEDVAVNVHCADSLLRVGSYRSLGAAANHFARESHIDEIASTLGTDPFELRMRNLADTRYRHVPKSPRPDLAGRPAPPPQNVGSVYRLGKMSEAMWRVALSLPSKGARSACAAWSRPATGLPQ